MDLFVRASNKLAQMMYTNLGYNIYRTVLGYYSGEEDAYGKLSIVVIVVIFAGAVVLIVVSINCDGTFTMCGSNR